MSDLSENPSERARMYIAGFEIALQKMTTKNQDTVVKTSNITGVSDTIHRYLKDARYYLENGKPTTSLASIAYAEGLMDALTFLGLAETKS